MARSDFDRQLHDLQDEVLLMASMTDKAIGRSVEALGKRDLELARRVAREDRLVNKKRYEIEEKCLTVIATQQPMAADLRLVASVMHIIVDLERMGDYAEGIANIVLAMGDDPLLKPLVDIPKMASRAREMLAKALDSFVNWDAETAKSVASMDDEVDTLYDRVYLDLLHFMIEDPGTIDRATHLLWVAHNLERIADRVTNICERAIFMVTGKLEDMNVSSY